MIESIYFGGPALRKLEHQGYQETIAFDGVLFLTENPDDFLQQIEEQEVLDTIPSELLHQISTDQIIPVVDLLTENISELGERALVGIDSIDNGVIKNSGKKVLVAGERFGKGSGREQAVWALLEAGIAGVIAPSFGPAFIDNAVNLGLLISSDMDLIEPIQKGNPVPLHAFLERKDPLQQQIIKAGGLFAYLNKINSGELPEPKISRERDPKRGMNILEQRLARALGAERVLPGDVSLLNVDLAASYVALSHLAESAIEKHYETFESILDPSSIFFFEDHFAYSERPQIPSLTQKQRLFAKKLDIPDSNYLKGRIDEGGGTGIIHRVMLENIDPRKTKVAAITDSHTCTLGALPIYATFVSPSVLAAAIKEGKIPFSVGETTRVEFTGQLPPGHHIRDAQLELAYLSNSIRATEVIEFGGEGLNNLSFDQVAALCNMVPEVFNGKIAVTEAFQSGIEYLVNRYQMSKEKAMELYSMPELNAEYEQVIRYDLSKVVPWISLPGDPGNGVSLAQYEEQTAIDKTYLVSCTLGLEDLIQAASVLRDRKISDGTQLMVVSSSKEIRDQAQEIGIMQVFREAGAVVNEEPACAHCIGEAPGSVNVGEVAISASNRNFPGRMGQGDTYLGSPILTALSAIYGQIPSAEQYKEELPRIIKNINDLNDRS